MYSAGGRKEAVLASGHTSGPAERRAILGPGGAQGAGLGGLADKTRRRATAAMRALMGSCSLLLPRLISPRDKKGRAKNGGKREGKGV